MSSSKPITIIGGGLAGLTLGIGLRQQGVSVVVWEAAGYPRHRVCGEFISGNGQAALERFGLRALFDEAGAVPARTVTFFCGPHRSPVRRLPAPALCLSRHSMDALLAREFRRLGGDLRENARCRPAPSGEGVVLAAGRRAGTRENGRRWFGLKVHAANVCLSADLEMHVSPASYVGVNRIDHGETNVCGLFAARRRDAAPDPKFEWLRGTPGSALRERLGEARFDGRSFCSVAGLSLEPQRAVQRQECCIGDALTMIPPVTGNGMSMAFESAEIAVGPLAAYSRGEAGWTQARKSIANGCDACFARRLAWARLLQWLLFSPLLRGPCGPLLLNSDALWSWMFSRTR